MKSNPPKSPPSNATSQQGAVGKAMGLTAQANESADQARLTVRARFGGGVDRSSGQHDESDDHAGNEWAVHFRVLPAPRILPNLTQHLLN